MVALVKTIFCGVRLNNTLTRLIAAVLLIAGIKVAAISIDQILTHMDPPRSAEDILAKYGYVREEKPKGVPTFQEFTAGRTDFTPAEYNDRRSRYLDEYSEKIAELVVGPKPQSGVTDWQARKDVEEARISDEFARLFPPRKVDTFIDNAANVGHSAAIGFVKSLRLITYLGGTDNAIAKTLTRVIETHQDAMTETEKIESERAIDRIETASRVRPSTGLRTRLENIRATWAVEALIVPLILLEVVFLRKIQHWNLPKLSALPRPSWPPIHRKMLWAKVTIEEARKHRKYGIKNGLIVLIFYLILSPLVVWGSLNKQLWEAGVTHDEFFTLSDSAAMVVFQLLISLVMAGIVLWAMFTKQPKFRSISTTVFASYFPIFFLLVLIFPNEAMGQNIAQGLMHWVIYGGLWVLYLQRSQRVRVTFEHTIRTPRPDQVEPTDDSTHAPHPTASQIDIEMPTALASEASSQAPEPITVPSSPTNLLLAPVRTISGGLPPAVADEDEFLWSQALTELDGSDRKNGLWAQCYAAHNGHEPAARADYLKTRVGQLRHARQTPHT